MLDRLPALADELGRLKVDVLVTRGTPGNQKWDRDAIVKILVAEVHLGVESIEFGCAAAV